ncbi:hypothetical protein [Virgisporangium aurantiacum]|uniref:Uncharacterized protein n=1 Tax=Virgisporangium aurantiacum TaxID=175570 RepID=A0A8J4E6V5_9ACTN|nr:hypothetical protein [Virgisporangium aurantiacum]GIJ63538.1 hypothetical protein Vau01_110540 [Virgisporangium aurantiacum]
MESDVVSDGEAVGPAVPGGWLAPLAWSMGFVGAPFEVVCDRLIAWRLGLGADLTE